LVATILQRFDYALRGKPDKGLLRRFLIADARRVAGGADLSLFRRKYL